MADESYQNPHAAREAELARTIARESVSDLFGGEETTHNGTALLVIVAFLLFLAAGVITVLILILEEDRMDNDIKTQLIAEDGGPHHRPAHHPDGAQTAVHDKPFRTTVHMVTAVYFFFRWPALGPTGQPAALPAGGGVAGAQQQLGVSIYF